MTPTTISSSMPCVSILAWPESPPGDGGGVSATRPALFGRSSKRSVVVRGGDAIAETDCECEWVRLIFFAGWWASLVEGGERADRDAPGSWMPSDGSDSDLRRVL
jgi:hypothetical protein